MKSALTQEGRPPALSISSKPVPGRPTIRGKFISGLAVLLLAAYALETNDPDSEDDDGEFLYVEE